MKSKNGNQQLLPVTVNESSTWALIDTAPPERWLRSVALLSSLHFLQRGVRAAARHLCPRVCRPLHPAGDSGSGRGQRSPSPPRRHWRIPANDAKRTILCRMMENIQSVQVLTAHSTPWIQMWMPTHKDTREHTHTHVHTVANAVICIWGQNWNIIHRLTKELVRVVSTCQSFLTFVRLHQLLPSRLTGSGAHCQSLNGIFSGGLALSLDTQTHTDTKKKSGLMNSYIYTQCIYSGIVLIFPHSHLWINSNVQAVMGTAVRSGPFNRTVIKCLF